ncbi:MAG TPA: hypothetical protein VHN78_15805, partial [Chloroflexota bacterium]|nr:hypothetical protein [Chloroflexota bacterium]
HYVLIDTQYVRPAELGLERHLRQHGRWDSFELYEVQAGTPGVDGVVPQTQAPGEARAALPGSFSAP